jgi:hypothetical protein
VVRPPAATLSLQRAAQAGGGGVVDAAAGFLLPAQHHQRGLAADGKLLLQVLLGVVVHCQDGDVETRLGLHRVEQLVLGTAGRAPVGAEVQRHRLVGLLRFSQGGR